MNNQIVIKNYLRYLFLLVFALFVFNRFVLRPWVVERGIDGLVLIVVNSLPNFVEAIMGTILLVAMALQLRWRFPERIGHMTDTFLYLAASILAGVYVISQELKIHNFGGNNIYDLYDIVASLLGLFLMSVVLNKYGAVK